MKTQPRIEVSSEGERVTLSMDFTECSPQEPEHWQYIRRRNQADEQRINQTEIRRQNEKS
jgi:hypothetical protein